MAQTSSGRALLLTTSYERVVVFSQSVFRVREGKILHVLLEASGGGGSSGKRGDGLIKRGSHQLLSFTCYHFTCYHLSFHLLSFIISRFIFFNLHSGASQLQGLLMSYTNANMLDQFLERNQLFETDLSPVRQSVLIHPHGTRLTSCRNPD